jgi:hypothetical protein
MRGTEKGWLLGARSAENSWNHLRTHVAEELDKASRGAAWRIASIAAGASGILLKEPANSGVKVRISPSIERLEENA